MYQYKLIKYRLDISNNNNSSSYPKNWIMFRKFHNISIQFDILSRISFDDRNNFILEKMSSTEAILKILHYFIF